MYSAWPRIWGGFLSVVSRTRESRSGQPFPSRISPAATSFETAEKNRSSSESRERWWRNSRTPARSEGSTGRNPDERPVAETAQFTSQAPREFDGPGVGNRSYHPGTRADARARRVSGFGLSDPGAPRTERRPGLDGNGAQGPVGTPWGPERKDPFTRRISGIGGSRPRSQWPKSHRSFSAKSPYSASLRSRSERSSVRGSSP